MDPTSLHLEIRNALSISDELSRYEHALGNDRLAAHLASMRTALGDLERMAGRTHADAGHPSSLLVEALERGVHELGERLDEVPYFLVPRVRSLIGYGDRIVFAYRNPDARVPARVVAGVLPLARVIPQDVHSVGDYSAAALYALSAKLARTSRARIVGAGLAGSVAGVSLVTDYRLSAVKILPIETHEKLDWATGLGAIAAPFLLGYVRKDPIASVIQIAAGLTTCVLSLFTDYRAEKGRTSPRRSKGGPSVDKLDDGNRWANGKPRPLEGLSSAPSGFLAPDRMLS